MGFDCISPDHCLSFYFFYVLINNNNINPDHRI